MLESQQSIDEVKETGFLGKTLERFVFSPRKDVGDTESSAMEGELYPACRGRGGGDRGDDVRDADSGVSSSSTRRRRRERFVKYCADFGREVCVQPWRERPRDGASVLCLLRRNVLAVLLVVVSGVITWESTVDDLRAQSDRTIIFPLYLPHSVALAVACVWTTAVAPGNLIGLYAVRLFMIWRGHQGFTSVNTAIMLPVALLATVQSHIGAFFLRKFLCTNGVKKIPTIDSVTEAVWYLATVFVLSLSFGMVIALCITATPLIQWSSFWRYWSTWWLGVLATMITVTPLLTHVLAWDYESSLRSPGRLVECVVVTLATSSVMVVVFFLNFEYFHPLPYLCFPLITWTAFRFNRVGWAVTVSTIAYCCALGSVRERGALYRLSTGDSVASPSLVIQAELFSCVIGVVGITLAAAVREKKNLTRRLHQLNIELEQTVDMRTLELRKANEELKISQKRAEQASHAKSDFLANMSHEIRTPIHGILGLTALLLESELTSDQEESLVSVKECADLLLHIINSVLDLAKIEAGRLEVEKVPFNVRKMVSSTFRMLQARAQQRGLQLLWDVEKSVPQTLVGDVGKLQQCLINLVGNALKFTHEGSVTVRVSVAAEHTTTPLNSDDELGNKVVGTTGEKPGNAQDSDIMVIEFEVRDTGIGISQEKLLDMFKPFTQADASTSRLYGGTGLGLCIVQRFVELLGGSIWAESELGKGSAFHFRLPFRLNSPKDSPSEMSPKVADILNGRQPWSLMGGLIFNPPGKHQSESSSGVEARNANLGTRGRSANDLLGLWNENNRGTGLDDDDDLDGNNSAPVTAYATLFRDSFRGLVRQSSHGSDFAWTLSPERVQGGGSSNVVVPELPRRLEKAQSDPAPASGGIPFVQRPMKWDSMPSDDRSVSNEVTQLGHRESLLMVSNTSQGINPEAWELVQPQNFVSASSQTSSTFSKWGVGSAALFRPHEGPMDSETPNGEAMEGDGGNMTGSAVIAHGESASVRSDLSRESSAELEKMLINKVCLKILLAEDNAINQKVASRQLEKHGHLVTIVGDGQQALDVISHQHDEFDLVLMDVQMPIMDGLKATDLIRKAESDNGWARLPVLGLTAHAIQGYQDTCFKHGMDGYLGKPFDIHQLLKTIGHLLPPETFCPRQ